MNRHRGGITRARRQEINHRARQMCSLAWTRSRTVDQIQEELLHSFPGELKPGEARMYAHGWNASLVREGLQALAAEDGIDASGLQDADVLRWLRNEVFPRDSLERLCKLFRCHQAQLGWPARGDEQAIDFTPRPNGELGLATVQDPGEEVAGHPGSQVLPGSPAGRDRGAPADPHGLHQIELIRRDLDDAISEGAMTGASLDDWEQTVLHLGQATRDRPASVLLTDLTADLVELKRVRSRCRSSSGLRRLTRVMAELAGLMCLTLIKLDERTAFRGWARTARIAADEAGDPMTSSWVRAQESYGYYYSGELTYAIDVARHACTLARNVACVGAALASALEARCQAALGQPLECRVALQRTEAILSRLDADSVVASAFGYNEAQLRFHEGSAFTHLQDTKSAWTAHERALELCPRSDYMDRTLIHLDHANCLAHDGDVSAAMAHMTRILVDLTDHQRCGIITLRARETLDAIPASCRTLPSVRDLRDLLMLPAGTGSEGQP